MKEKNLKDRIGLILLLMIGSNVPMNYYLDEIMKLVNGEFDLIKAIEEKQKVFNVGKEEDTIKPADWYEGLNFGFEQTLRTVKHWFNPDWYKEKEKFRTGLFTKGLFIESLGSILLLILKGVPYKLGYYKAILDKKT